MVFTLKIIKLSGALWYNQRVRHREIYEPGTGLKQTCSNLSKKLGLNRTVRLLESGYCKLPLVLGYLKPVILLPAGLLTHLPADRHAIRAEQQPGENTADQRKQPWVEPCHESS